MRQMITLTAVIARFASTSAAGPSYRTCAMDSHLGFFNFTEFVDFWNQETNSMKAKAKMRIRALNILRELQQANLKDEK